MAGGRQERTGSPRRARRAAPGGPQQSEGAKRSAACGTPRRD